MIFWKPKTGSTEMVPDKIQEDLKEFSFRCLGSKGIEKGGRHNNRHILIPLALALAMAAFGILIGYNLALAWAK